MIFIFYFYYILYIFKKKKNLWVTEYQQLIIFGMGNCNGLNIFFVGTSCIWSFNVSSS